MDHAALVHEMVNGVFFQELNQLPLKLITCEPEGMCQPHFKCSSSIRSHVAPGVSAVTTIRCASRRMAACLLAGAFCRILGRTACWTKTREYSPTVHRTVSARLRRAFPPSLRFLVLSSSHIVS